MGVTTPLRDLDKSGQESQSVLSFSDSIFAKGRGLKLWEMAQDTFCIPVLTHGSSYQGDDLLGGSSHPSREEGS